MTDKRAAGDHLGYVAYHIEAISRRDEELEDEIKEIRKEFGGEWDRIREDRKALKRFRHDIQKRLKKLEEQAENTISKTFLKQRRNGRL